MQVLRLFLIGLLCCWGLSATAQNSKEVRKMKAQRSELKRQIEASESLLSSTKKDVASQLSNLALLDAKIGEKKNYVERLTEDADSLNLVIKQLQRQADTLQAELTLCKANYRKAMTFVSRNKAKQSRWMFVLMAKDFRELYRRMRYAAQYSKYQKAQGEMVQRKEMEVREKQKEVMAAKKQKERLLTEGKAQQKDLEKKQEERKGIVEELNKKKSSIQRVINRDRKKYQDLNIRIDRLIKAEIAAAERRRKEEERRRKAAEAAARRKAGKKSSSSKSTSKESSSTVKFNEADDADRKLSNDFTDNKGRLPVPITGGYAITSRYGTYNVDGLSGVRLENKGINITGRRGAQARCIFNGEVVTVANFGGSYTVIIRHGNYYSVYNNLASVSVRRGQQVKTEQQIGPVATDNTGNCVLHFQLRKRTSTLNPQSWIRR